MQKTLVKKHNSFSSHCKKIWSRKKSDSLSKSFDTEPEHSRQPVTDGAEAVTEAFYDACSFEGDTPPWYFGKITRKDAESILQRYEPGRFLVRDSETVKKAGAYTLSLRDRDRDKCLHHKIETLPDQNLVIKGHEDKPFSNLVKLMSYFVKSQEKNIRLTPICEEQGKASTPPSNQPIQQQSYEIMDPMAGDRPPVPGCEDKPLPEKNSNGCVSPRDKVHGYENLPDKQRARPPLKSRATEPVLPSYQNLPPKGINRSPPMPVRQHDSYEPMASHGSRNEEELKPSLPPRKPANTAHGYENLPEKAAVPLPPRQPTGDGYINLPAKSGRSMSEPPHPPDLPPRSQRQNPLGYENVPSSGRSLHPTSLPYQNVSPQAASRHSRSRTVEPPSPTGRPPPPMKRATTLPAHIIENTLGQMNWSSEDPF